MVRCTFTRRHIEPGTGKMYVKKDGTILWFISSKAQKNYLKLERDARFLKWTGAYKKGMKPKAAKEAVKEETVRAEVVKPVERTAEAKPVTAQKPAKEQAKKAGQKEALK